MSVQQINYCSQCGGTMKYQKPDGDNFLRAICQNCSYIHYENPKIIAGCLIYSQRKVLLCKRGIQPRLGFWTTPAGFMENGESTRQAAQRETIEEANAAVEIENLFVLANITHINQVYMLYLAELQDGNFYPGEESTAVKLFAEDEIPWQELAFPTVRFALKQFFKQTIDAARATAPSEVEFSRPISPVE